MDKFWNYFPLAHSKWPETSHFPPFIYQWSFRFFKIIHFVGNISIKFIHSSTRSIRLNFQVICRSRLQYRCNQISYHNILWLFRILWVHPESWWSKNLLKVGSSLFGWWANPTIITNTEHNLSSGFERFTSGLLLSTTCRPGCIDFSAVMGCYTTKHHLAWLIEQLLYTLRKLVAEQVNQWYPVLWRIVQRS